jgi:hypothetical protein
MPRLAVFQNMTKRRLPVFKNITEKYNTLNEAGKFHNRFNTLPPMLGRINPPHKTLAERAREKGMTLEQAIASINRRKTIEERAMEKGMTLNQALKKAGVSKHKGGKTRRRRNTRRSR